MKRQGKEGKAEKIIRVLGDDEAGVNGQGLPHVLRRSVQTMPARMSLHCTVSREPWRLAQIPRNDDCSRRTPVTPRGGRRYEVRV